jgi:hypothetical protein
LLRFLLIYKTEGVSGRKILKWILNKYGDGVDWIRLKMVVFWVVTPCSLRRYNPEDSQLCTHRRENLKSYWIHVAQDREKWQTFVNTVMNHWFL